MGKSNSGNKNKNNKTMVVTRELFSTDGRTLFGDESGGISELKKTGSESGPAVAKVNTGKMTSSDPATSVMGKPEVSASFMGSVIGDVTSGGCVLNKMAGSVVGSSKEEKELETLAGDFRSAGGQKEVLIGGQYNAYSGGFAQDAIVKGDDSDGYGQIRILKRQEPEHPRILSLSRDKEGKLVPVRFNTIKNDKFGGADLLLDGVNGLDEMDKQNGVINVGTAASSQGFDVENMDGKMQKAELSDNYMSSEAGGDVSKINSPQRNSVGKEMMAMPMAFKTQEFGIKVDESESQTFKPNQQKTAEVLNEARGDTSGGKMDQGNSAWANLFKEQQPEVKFYKPETINGIAMARFPKIEVENGLKKWDNVVVCKVIGGHPPVVAIKLCFDRIWKGAYEKVWQVRPGVFMVKFFTKDFCDEILDSGMIFFDNKPVVIKKWSQNFDFDEPATVPVWVQLPGLDIVYWEPSLLCRLVSTLGIPVRIDKYTYNQDKLNFARVLVEMKIGEPFPDKVPYIDENDVIQHQDVEYEWKPVKCGICKVIGHKQEECRWTTNATNAQRNVQLGGIKPKIAPNIQRKAPRKPMQNHMRAKPVEQQWVAVGIKTDDQTSAKPIVEVENSENRAKRINTPESEEPFTEVHSKSQHKRGKQGAVTVPMHTDRAKTIATKESGQGINEGGAFSVSSKFQILSDPPDDQ